LNPEAAQRHCDASGRVIEAGAFSALPVFLDEMQAVTGATALVAAESKLPHAAAEPIAHHGDSLTIDLDGLDFRAWIARQYPSRLFQQLPNVEPWVSLDELRIWKLPCSHS
jgi:hypothetical protein